MTPERRKTIGVHTVEEYYWAGDMVVYIDNYICHGSFEGACTWAEEHPTGKSWGQCCQEAQTIK